MKLRVSTPPIELVGKTSFRRILNKLRNETKDTFSLIGRNEILLPTFYITLAVFYITLLIIFDILCYTNPTLNSLILSIAI